MTPRPFSPALASTAGDYTVEEQVGEGGFGAVFRARAPGGTLVALKRARDAGADPDDLAAEFRVLARLRHENIVPVIDFGFDGGGAPYLVTEWVEGPDLGTFGRGKPPAALAPVLAGVLRALEYLHARGVLHRDLKPQNVLVGPDGRARVIDFGLAGAPGGGSSRSGTPAYAPPERVLGRPEDGRADLYSFGVILRELAGGASPALDALIARLTAPHPSARPATANETIAALAAATGVPLAEEAGSTGPDAAAAALPGLVGRERELARFRRLLAGGRERVLVLAGGPGAGKSHLLRALAVEACAAGARPLEARTLAEAGGADRLLGEAGLRRIALFIDDAHLFAPAELEDVVALATRLGARSRAGPDRGLVLVVALRPAEARDRGLGDRIERLLSLPRTRRLDLGPLAPADMRAFVAEVLGRADLPESLLAELYARGRGLPAEIAALVRALARSGALVRRAGAWVRGDGALVFPPSAAEALRATVAALDEPAREALRWLHAAGPLRPAALRRLSATRERPIERATLEALLAAGLIARAGAGPEGVLYTLADERIADALGPDPAGPGRHDALARERRDDPERAIAHAARGSDRGAALEALAIASARSPRDPAGARALLAPLVAGTALGGPDHARAVIALAGAEVCLDLRERARARLDALEAVPPALAPAFLAARARALGRDDERLEETLACIEAALAGPAAARFVDAGLAAVFALEAAGPELRGRLEAICERVRALGAAGRVEGEAGEDEEARARRSGAGGARWGLETRGRAALALGSLRQVAGDDAGARAAFEEARRLLARASEPQLELDAMLRLAGQLGRGTTDVRAGLALAAEAAALAERLGDVHAVGRALAIRAALLVRADDLRGAWAAARRARRKLRGRGPAADYVRSLMSGAYLALKLGRARESERLARRALALAAGEAHAATRLGAQANLAFARIRQGKPAAADLERALAEAERRGLADVLLAGRYLLGLDAVERGDLERARRILADPVPPSAFHLHCLRVDLEVLAGNAGRAAEIARDLRPEGAFAEAKAESRRALAALAGGDPAGALEALARARRSGGEREDLFLAIEIALIEAEAHLASGERGRAEDALAAAARLIVPEEMPGFEARRTALALRVGIAPREEPRALLDRLETLGLERDARALARALDEPRAAAALDLPAAAAARLLSVYRALARERDPDALLPRVLDAAAGLAGAARAFLLLREGDRLRAVLGRGAGVAADARRGTPSRSIAEEALRTGRPIRLDAADADPRFASQRSVACLGLGGVLAVPLAGGAGVIYLDDGGARRPFAAHDEAVLAAFAEQASLAIALGEALGAERRRREQAERRTDELRRELERTARDLDAARAALAAQAAHAGARFEGMIGRTAAMRRVFAMVERCAPREVPVLIVGETGTGKELCARAVHARSPRRDRPFVAVNCGAVSPSLLESELFGHEAGAFTGAARRQPGIFEQADGGTVFLDEVGEMPLAMQAALLRVLESGEVRRVGARAPIRVDVRVIAATHRDLRALVEAGRFREDLLFRLRVFPIEIPPLRERLEDLPAIAEAILAELAATAGTRPPALTPLARRKLLSHAWPGNVRELRNVLARAAILSSLEGAIAEDAIVFDAPRGAPALPTAPVLGPPLEVIDFQVAKDRWIKAFLEATLRKAAGNVTRAAELTGMKRQAFGRLIATHGIDAARFRP